MSDEQRADVLARTLEGYAAASRHLTGGSHPDGTGTDGEAGAWEGGTLDELGLADPVPMGTQADQGMEPDQPDDPELAELIGLAARLQRLGPSMALIARAEASFDPAFAQRLKGTVLAAHAATYHTALPAGPALVQTATLDEPAMAGNAIPSPVGSGSITAATGSPLPSVRVRGASGWEAFRSRLRALWGLLLLAGVAIAVAVVVALNSATPRVQHAAEGATVTIAPRSFLLQRSTSGPLTDRSRLAPPPQQAATGTTAGTASGAVPVPPGSTVPGGGFLPPVAAGNAPRSSVVPSVDAVPSTRGTAVPRGTATPKPEFRFDSMAPGQPLAGRPAAVATIPVHYRGAPLPSTAPSYALSYRPLSAAAVGQIVASFPGLRRSTPTPTVLGRLGAVRYMVGTEQLEIVAATGEVRYSYRVLPANGAHGSLDAAVARAGAGRWLATHGLLPSGVAARASLVAMGGDTVEVRFAPALPHPFRDDAAAGTVIALRVRLDGAGRVLSAERLWPSLLAAPAAVLPSLPRSIPAPPTAVRRADGATGGAPKGSVASGAGSFEVGRVEIVYTASGAGRSARLLPGYLLLGRLAVSGGVGQPYSLVVAGAAPSGFSPASPTRTPPSSPEPSAPPTATHP